MRACSPKRAFSRASSSVLGPWVITWVFNSGWRLPKKWFNWTAGVMLCFSAASMRRAVVTGDGFTGFLGDAGEGLFVYKCGYTCLERLQKGLAELGIIGGLGL